MKLLIPLLIFSLAVAAEPMDDPAESGAASEDYRIVREGSYWVRIDTGTVAGTPRLRVFSPGKVHTQGETRGNIRFVVKRRVRAPNFDVARLLLAGPAVAHSVRGDWGMLVVPGSRSRAVATELELHLPRVMKQASFQVNDGTVSAFDMDGTVNVLADAGSVIMDRIRGGVSARTGGGEIRLGSIGGSIDCLSGGGGISIEGAGGDSVIETAGGEVFVRQARGTLRASSGGGNIQVLQALNRVDAQTNGGIVEVLDARGMVYANTSGGAIQIGTANGVSCQSAAGAIQLENVSGALNVSTLMGSIVAGITSRRLEDSFLNASSGDITVLIPSNLAVTVQAESEAAGVIGKILSDFPEIRVIGFWANGKPVLAKGALNGGGPLLKLSASGGLIYLKRQH
jgi:DUF4097 and DUF4098 domain-containing protein YvlB